MRHFESDVDSERAALNALFDHAAAAAKIDSKLLDSLASNRNARIVAATAKRDAAAALYGLDEGKAKEATYQIVIPVAGPPEFMSATVSVVLGPSITSGQAHIVGTSDNAAELVPALADGIKGSQRVYELATTMPSTINVDKGDETASLGGGYRYRVPTSAWTKLSVYTDSTKAKPEFLPLTQYVVIAQYGPIAALPSDFKGKGGHVMVKLWPDSGGLQSVGIGADPIPTTAVTSVVDEAFNQLKARQDKAAAAAAAAASADPELDKLTRQQKILTLQKEIKDLQDALNKSP
jgi:hypothetical protein